MGVKPWPRASSLNTIKGRRGSTDCWFFRGAPVFALSLDVVSWLLVKIIQLPPGTLQSSRADPSAS